MGTQNRRSTFLAALFGAALLFGAGTTAHALSITYGPDCGSGNCFGSVYTLSTIDANTVVGATTTQYDFLYTVNTTGYTGAGTGLYAIAFKLANETDILSSTLLNPTNGFSQPVFGDLSAGGCSGQSSAGFICSAGGPLGVGSVNGSTYSFTFRTVLNNGTLFGDPNQWTIKAQYAVGTNFPQDSRGLTSVTGGVPVPGTSLMFGLGVALFFGWHHRSRHQLGRGDFAA